LTQPLQKATTHEEPVPTDRHFSFEKAMIAQREFSRLVNERSYLPKNILYVAGVDAAYTGQLSFTASTLLDYRTLKSIEVQLVRNLVKVPYRSGFLGFREAPAMIEAVERLKIKPDVVFVDGHGLAHPRGFGLACHVGVILDTPTIGVAKSMFHGEAHEDRVLDKQGHRIAAIIKAHRKTLYVSIGNKISLDAAIQITKHCTLSNMPEPLKLAHHEATRMARKMGA
jgi:deoxyribonuclease V